MHRQLRLSLVIVVAMGSIAALQGQSRDPVSPGVGRAVLLATNSIQVDEGTEIVSGDVVVNDVSAGPFLGEAQIALDRDVRTPAGGNVIADSVDIDGGAVVGGDVFANTLTNGGTIAGQIHTPLALPVFQTLPAMVESSPGDVDVTVPDGATQDLAEGAYAMLIVGKGSTVRLTGSGYAFTQVSVARGGAILCTVPCRAVVQGRLTIETNGLLGPESGSGLDASGVAIHAGGSVTTGAQVRISANVSAPEGAIVFGRDVRAAGAFYGRDIQVGRSGRLEVTSLFNLPPTAHPQTVFTDGSTPLAITLTGTDPEGQPLVFEIAAGPAYGSLSLSGPMATYTPAGAMNLQDAFTFRVTDPGGASGVATVSINPPRAEPPPPPPSTVEASDLAASVTQETAATLVLTAAAPEGVALTFGIVPGSGPFHGTLGAVVNGTQATVPYTPDAGFTGVDSFDFEACGVISGDNVCDSATYTVTVLPHRVELPDLATDVNVTANAGQQVLISLGLTSVETLRTVVIRPNAAFLDPVEVAGTVADADDDGVGDNHMTLPASVPVFMSAGVGMTGANGSNGTVRMEFEWDISGLGGSSFASALRSADVLLNTHRGTIDSLDTRFYNIPGSNDGSLTDSDYARPAELIKGATMPVPAGMAVGSDGSFSFTVFGELLSALYAGQNFLTLQGRVDESLAGPARGLEVRTSVELNREAGLEPMLAITTPGVTAPLTYTVLTLPTNGTLLDNGTPITDVQYTLPGSSVAFVPAPGFIGETSFIFQVSSGLAFDEATVNIRVILADCATDPAACDDGR